jgi:hypothetical protein
VSASGDRSPFEEVLHIGIMVVIQAAHGHALLVSLQLPSDIAVLAAVVGIQRETTVSPQLALGTETVGRLQRRVSLAFNLLAAAEAVGRGRYLAQRLTNFGGRPGRKGPVEMGRSLSGRQLRFGQKGGDAVGKTKRGKGTKWMVLGDGEGVLLGVRLESASPAEVTLADATLKEVRVPRPKGRPRQKPKRVIADRGYDSDPLRQR